MPVAVTAFWAVSVWGGLLGSALLMVRSKWAVQAFFVALIGLMGTSFYQFALTPNPISIYDTPVNLAAWLIALVSALYALRTQALGFLR